MCSWIWGRIIGQKPPLKPKEVLAIRTRLQMTGAVRDLTLFNLAIDSKLRACDLVAISVAGVAISGRVRHRGDHHPEEDRPTRAIRTHRSNAGRCRCMDWNSQARGTGLPVSQPRARIAASVDAAI